jgi:hypothetical protein
MTGSPMWTGSSSERRRGGEVWPVGCMSTCSISRGTRHTTGLDVNLNPPNPGSDAFHAKLGFKEVGQAVLYGGAKTVRYMEKPLSGG